MKLNNSGRLVNEWTEERFKWKFETSDGFSTSSRDLSEDDSRTGRGSRKREWNQSSEGAKGHVKPQRGNSFLQNITLALATMTNVDQFYSFVNINRKSTIKQTCSQKVLLLNILVNT